MNLKIFGLIIGERIVELGEMDFFTIKNNPELGRVLYFKPQETQFKLMIEEFITLFMEKLSYFLDPKDLFTLRQSPKSGKYSLRKMHVTLLKRTRAHKSYFHPESIRKIFSKNYKLGNFKFEGIFLQKMDDNHTRVWGVPA